MAILASPARRLIEPALQRHLCEHTGASQLQQLRTHVALETEARATNDRRAIICLSGKFHIRIADLVDNQVMSKMMRELASLTCLIIDAIAAGRVEQAVASMIEHLNHIEAVLDMSPPPSEEEDLEAVLGL